MFDQKKVMTLQRHGPRVPVDQPARVDRNGCAAGPHHAALVDRIEQSEQPQASGGGSAISLKPGDKIVLRMAPLRSGEHGGLFLDVKLPNGKVLDSGLPKDGTPVNVPQA